MAKPDGKPAEGAAPPPHPPLGIGTPPEILPVGLSPPEKDIEDCAEALLAKAARMKVEYLMLKIEAKVAQPVK